MNLIHISQPRLNNALVTDALHEEAQPNLETMPRRPSIDTTNTTNEYRTVYKSHGTLDIKLPITDMTCSMKVVMNEIITKDQWRHVEISVNVPIQWNPKAFKRLKQMGRLSSKRKLLLLVNKRIAIQINADELLGIKWSPGYFKHGQLKIEDDRFHGCWQLEFIMHNNNFFCLDRIIFSENLQTILSPPNNTQEIKVYVKSNN